MSLIQSAIAKAKAKALAEKMGATFEGAAETISATASGGGLVRIGSQLYDAATTQQDGVIAVKNVGRPGAALYAPATGSGATVTRTSSGSSGGSSAPTYHSQLLGLTTGDDHPQYLNNYRADARYVPLDRMVNAEAPIYTVDSDDGRLTEDVRLALRRATNSGLQVIGAQPGLAVGVSGLGLSVSAETVILTSSSDVSAGTSSILASNAGALTLIALSATSKITTPQIETAAGNLTLAPASGITSAGAQLHTTTLIRTPLIDTANGPLSLKAASNVVQMAATADLQTDHYVSQLTGWRITYPGAADFRYLYADELHAKAFIADLEQALAGGQIIAKSVAMVAESITVPAAGAAVTIRVRDLPSAPDVPVFASGDIVRLRKFTRADGSLTIADAWGAVTSYADGAGANQGTQTWTFTRSAAPNAGGMSAGTVIAPDALILDYGAAGNGIYEVSAIDGQAAQNSPYARVATWTGHPATGLTLRAQFGNLRGTYGYDSAEFGVAMGSPTAANITVDATNGIRLRHGTTDKIALDASGNSYFSGIMQIGSAGEIRQGSVSSGTINDAWPLNSFTGLRVWRDGSIGRIGGYNANTLQWGADTSGKLTAGAGDVILDASGITQLSATSEAGSTEPPLTPLLPAANQRISIWDKPGTTDWGYNSIYTGPQYYSYPGLEWLRMYVSSQHFVQWYTGSIPQNWHAWDSVIEVPDNTLPDKAGTVTRRRLWLKAPEIYLDSSQITFTSEVRSNLVSRRTVDEQFDLGSSGKPWRKIYADEVIAGTISGSTSLGGSTWQHDAADMYIHSSSASARTLYVANPGAGSMHLDIEGNITLGGTVDGVDIAAHAGNANAHHARSHAITSTSDHTASGLTAGQVLRASGATTFAWAQLAHSDLSGIGTNTHAQIDSHISTADTHVAHSGVTITAGDGLTGGGTIAATRTLTLGTPGSSTATSTNAVTSTSHTHAIDSTIARSAITVSAGNGLTGGGDLTANRTLTLGTPGGLDAGTTNAVTSTSHTHAITANVAASALTVASTAAVGTSAALARADHIHAITTSSNPGAAASILATNSSGYLRLVRLGIGKDPTSPLDVSGAAAISGALSAGSGAITGALTVGGDLTVGSTVLQVSASGTRVGINRAADQQFDLDVAGAIRGQYLIGRHAIQLASAVGVWHFDGPAPYALDFTGSNASHMGVGGTETGGVIYRPGKFGKAVQIAPATTNLLTNPSFETNTTGWGTDYPATTTLTRTAGGLYGDYYLAVAATGNGNCFSPAVTVANATAYAVSFWYRTTSSVRVYVREYGNATDYGTATLPAATEWTRYTILLTTPASASTSIRLVFYDLAVGESIDIDGVQIEKKPYVTPYCDGSLGQGHSWSGTPHASTSSRTGATLQYANAGGLSVQAGTILMWVRLDSYNGDGGGLFGSGANTEFDAYVSETGVVIFRTDGNSRSAGTVVPGAWTHLAFTWDAAANSKLLYINGVQVASSTYAATATLGSTLYIGSLTAGAVHSTNGLIDEFVLTDYAMDAKLVRAIYESDAPVFVESSVFHWRSPSRVPIWVDEFGLWARGVSGNEILGLYGGDPRSPSGNVTRSWGGITMEENDVVIGRAAQAAVHWDDSAGTLQIGRPSASNLLLSGGSAQMRDSSTVWGSWSNSGVVIGRVANSTSRVEITSAGAINLINRNGSGVDTTAISLAANGSASFAGAITASSGSITGVLTLGSSGGIYQGSGTFASPTTGLKLWNDSGTGRIGGYNAGALQWYAGTDGKLYAGGGNVLLGADGLLIKAANEDNPSYANSYGIRFSSPDSLQSAKPLMGALYVNSALVSTKYRATGNLMIGWGGTGELYDYSSLSVRATTENRSATLNLIADETAFTSSAILSATSITLSGGLEYARFAERSATPSNPASGTEANLYMKADKLIIQYNDGGTVRYKYLDLTGTGVTWTHTTTAP